MRTQSNLPQDSILGNRNEVHRPEHHKQHKGSVHSCVFWLTLKTFPLLVCHLHIQWLSVDEDRISWHTFPHKRSDILWRTRNTSPYVLMMMSCLHLCHHHKHNPHQELAGGITRIITITIPCDSGDCGGVDQQCRDWLGAHIGLKTSVISSPCRYNLWNTDFDSVRVDEVPDGGYGLDGDAATDDGHALN